MTIEKKLLGTSPSGDGPTNVDDVFSTYLYTGTESTKTITNGIDLAGEGGLVWLKMRNDSNNHNLFDTERGVTKELNSNSEAIQNTVSGLTSFNSNGFTVGSEYGNNGGTMASWTFRKKEKFFDVVTYTGNSNGSPQTIAHNLGSVPAMIIVKCTSLEKDWIVYHKNSASSSPEDKYLILNSTRETRDYTYWSDTAPTDSAFTVGDDYDVNGYNATYVAYLFADNSSEDSEEQMIKCGSFTTANNANFQEINLGWEPQWILFKSATSVDSFYIIDSMRGASVGGTDSWLLPNTSGAEQKFGDYFNITSTGFSMMNNAFANSQTFIWMAIRAPLMVEPKAATDVFSVAQTVDNNSAGVSTGFASDMSFWSPTATTSGCSNSARLLGTKVLRLDTNNASTGGYSKWDRMDTWFGGEYGATCNICVLKRAKGFFDVVVYKGTSSSGGELHSLGVVPEMIWIKPITDAVNANVYFGLLGANKWLSMGSDSLTPVGTDSEIWANTTPTDTRFFVSPSGYNNNNLNNKEYIAYLFATLAGISKCGSYTGNGSSQTISCGFSAGSRFVLIKRTNASGEWYWWDTVQGIVAGNDPYRTIRGSAQVTGNDSVDPHSSGFIVNQVSATNINVSSSTYIFYAIA